MTEPLIELTGELSCLNGFVGDGLIDDVLYRLKSGKEATVFCCRAGPATDLALVGAKIYRANRSFKNDAVYQEGRVVRDARARRALAKKSRFGKTVQSTRWIGHEFAILQELYDAGCDVPRPLKEEQGSAILMEYFGDEEGPAPMLKETRIGREEAGPLFQRIVDNVRLMLACHYVHGDLSPYNILYWQGRAVVIDFPQAVDARQNRHARELLRRDLDNVYEYFKRYGVEASPWRIADSMWHQYMRGVL